VVGAYLRARAQRESEYPGSGRRDKVFQGTLQGIMDALNRNIVQLSKRAVRAQELHSWDDEHLHACASNHTLIVESIFSHMRRLEDHSHVTRGPWREAVVILKLHPVDLTEPPSFLPQHLTSEAGISSEGREAEAGLGSRARRGEAHFKQERLEAEAAATRISNREEASAAKLTTAALELEGGSILSALHPLGACTAVCVCGGGRCHRFDRGLRLHRRIRAEQPGMGVI
jgi:hypothetical protein